MAGINTQDTAYITGSIRVGIEGTDPPIDIPANGILQVSLADGAAIILGGGGATSLVGIEYLDGNGDPITALESNQAEVKRFSAAPGVSITVMHDQAVDLALNPIPDEQKIITSSAKNFLLPISIVTELNFVYLAGAAPPGFRWTIADRFNYNAVPGDWAGAPPNTVSEAITRIAATVAVLNGAPIP